VALTVDQHAVCIVAGLNVRGDMRAGSDARGVSFSTARSGRDFIADAPR
jgi:hypothetical protein